jgi:hypothetical protein
MLIANLQVIEQVHNIHLCNTLCCKDTLLQGVPSKQVKLQTSEQTQP